MRAVVTGPSGHLGTVLVQQLVDAGHDVRAVCYDEARSLDGMPIERMAGNVLDPDSLRAAFVERDVLFHLAGVISIDGRDLELMRRVNVDGATHVAAAALEAGISRMVHVSSIHALDVYRRADAIDETTPPCPDERSQPAYNRTKAAGEAAVRSFAPRGLDVCIVNPTGLIGPPDPTISSLGAVLIRMARGLTPAMPDGAFDFVDVRDVASSILAVADRGRSGESYILAGETLTVLEMAAWVHELVDRRSMVIPIPIWLLDKLTFLSWLAARITGGKRGVTRDALHTLNSRMRVDGSKARRELGHAPRPIRDSIRDALYWYADAGHTPPRLRRRIDSRRALAVPSEPAI